MDHGTDARAPTASRDEPASTAGQASALIESRRTILPKRLVAPGPDEAQLHQVLRAAAAAPDHGGRVPWRFVIVPQQTRGRLALVFEQALRERDVSATPGQLGQAREKAYRAPLLLLAVARMGEPGDEIPDVERLVSAGCAIQNMLLVATAQGFGTSLTSGKAMDSTGLRELFALGPLEQAICFLNIGTPVLNKLPHVRPVPADFVSVLGERQ